MSRSNVSEQPRLARIEEKRVEHLSAELAARRLAQGARDSAAALRRRQ
jgi:hypothetical protein